MLKNLIFLVTITFVSCIEKQQEKINNFTALAITDTLSIPLDTLTSPKSNYYQVFSQNKKEYLAVENSNLNAIEMYDMSSSKLKLIKRLVFSRSDDKLTFSRLAGFTVVNFDSIFVYDNKMTKLILIDTVKSIKYEKKMKDNESSLLAGHLEATQRPILWKDNKLFFAVAPYSDPLVDNTYFSDKYSLEVCINPSKNYEVTSLKIHYPEKFKGKFWGIMYCFFSRTEGKDSDFIYSFAIDEQLTQTNFNKNTTNKIDLMPKINVEAYSLKDDYMNYYLYTPHYGQIFYDKWRNVYYRFSYQAINKIVEKPSHYDKPCTIMVYSEDFKKITEYNLPKDMFLSAGSFVTSRGLCVSLSHPKKPKLSENKADFAIFTLK